MKRLSSLVLVLFAVVFALPALAEEPLGAPGWVPGPDKFGDVSTDERPIAGKWGVTDWVQYNVAAIGFSPLNDGMWSHGTTGWSYKASGSNTATCVDIHLPSGALLQWITTWTDDTDAASINISLYSMDLVTNTGTTAFSFTTVGTPGIERVARAVTPNITIDNDRNAYALCAFHGATGTTLRNAGGTFWYKLQVSPAPATATFPGDVPTTHPFFRYVEAMADSGLTGGCATNLFCPDTPVTRGQLSVFLAAALGLHFPN